MTTNKNCITYWLPKIENHVPTPRTRVVLLNEERDLFRIFDGEPLPKWFPSWVDTLKSAALTISKNGPWFLRTGVFSGKHDWSRCCGVTDLSDIGDHVLSLFEMSHLVDILGLPCDVWAVREWLDGTILLEYEPFGRMPIRREFRGFAREGEVLCVHPYWPPDALDESVTEMPEFLAMNHLGDDEMEVVKLIKKASEQVEGEWSIDCLATNHGWYVTDMAVAEQSYHWPSCEHLLGIG